MLYDSQPVYSRAADRKASRIKPYALPIAAVGLALLTDFELMPLGAERDLTFDCVRNP